ncbi:STM3941 family protein [Aequorivita lipolytica]|uniref:Uncharacterized protein n=1 Tax=Aequorivita lipolytica TaxID=153267 RepID=A0A5C6YQV0_9FLAO|nr:STM3941 family protein [Aequorivita lipolytica]TXD69823.1 hypothetical protein ESV24_05115 [Aequorivita lipolytica]SRX50366.1 hypothetical protein AEQU2_00838 [Aequorivita lipolytica]
MNENIEIPLSKNKILLLFLGAITFVLLGFWLAIDPENFKVSVFRYRSPELIRVVGIIGVALFGIFSFFIFKKVFDKKFGLIIDKNGITDNSNATSIGLVKWTDIIGIRVLEVVNQKFVMIDVSNPEHYIGLKKNGIGKMAMKANYNKYGSPISITANSLKADFKEVWEIIEKQYEKNALQHRI